VRDELAREGLRIQAAELIWRPTVLFPITDKTAAEKAITFIEKLENLDDVSKVWVNFDISDDILSTL